MADPVTSNSTVWQWVSGSLLSFAMLLIGIVWRRSENDKKKTDARLDEIETRLGQTASREELSDVTLVYSDIVRRSEYEQYRREMREDMGIIHAKIDGASRELNSKIDTIGKDLNSQLNTNQVAILNAISNIRN